MGRRGALFPTVRLYRLHLLHCFILIDFPRIMSITDTIDAVTANNTKAGFEIRIRKYRKRVTATKDVDYMVLVLSEASTGSHKKHSILGKD